MCGGYYNYQQSAIQDIIYNLETFIKIETEPRPPLIQELCVNVWKIVNGTYKSDTHYNFDTYEEALNYFKELGYTIEILSTEPQKRKFIASIISKNEELTFEIREIIYEYYKDEAGNQILHYDFSKETLDELKKGLDILNKAYIYVQQMNWLFSSDGKENTFHERLKKELKKYEKSKIQ